MLDRVTVERIAAEYDGQDGCQDERVFSEQFRVPIASQGFLCKQELLEIVNWKAARQNSNAGRNDPTLVEDVTRRAFAQKEPSEAARVLCNLKGVGTRMASAILTVFNPKLYTVMDWRAWESINNAALVGQFHPPTPDLSLDSCDTYAVYLNTCHRLARHLQVSLRTLDKCLWMLKGRPPDCLAPRWVWRARCSVAITLADGPLASYPSCLPASRSIHSHFRSM
jgi:hypothetical protein